MIVTESEADKSNNWDKYFHGNITELTAPELNILQLAIDFASKLFLIIFKITDVFFYSVCISWDDHKTNLANF